MPSANTETHVDLIKNKIRGLLKQKLTVLQDQASIVGADMEALMCRITKKGHRAKVDDLKAGTWYRAAAEARMLQDVYSYVCEITGTPEVPIFPTDEEDTPIADEGDEAAESET